MQRRGVTFVAFVPLVPASELLALGGGDVGVVGAVHDGRDHTLMEQDGGRGRVGQMTRFRTLEVSQYALGSVAQSAQHGKHWGLKFT